MVHLYITVVALGLGLVTSADWDRVETRDSRIRYYDPSCSSVTAKIYIAGSFDDEIPSTAKLLRHHCSNGENSWTSVSRRDDAQHVVASLESLHKFLVHVRRLSKRNVPGTRRGQGSGWHFGVGVPLLKRPPRSGRQSAD